MQSLFFSVSLLASQSYGCQLGSEAADAAAFDWLAARHFSGRADTPTFVYVPDQMGGVGLALNRLLLAYHYAALHGRPLVVMNARRWKAAQSGELRGHKWSEWRWTRGVSLGHGRNATMADLYWPSTSDGDIETHRDTEDITHLVINCETFRRCGWANRVPEDFASRCVIWWFSRLAHFHLRLSERLAAAVRAFALDRCPPTLCGRTVGGRFKPEPNGTLLGRRLLRAAEQKRRERATLLALPSVALASRLPRYRPSLASDLAQRLLLLPGVSPQMHVLSLHVRGGDSCYAGERPRCRSMQEAWPFLEQALPANNSGAPGQRPLVLLSTDTADVPPQGAYDVRSFEFSREKYEGDQLIEWRLSGENDQAHCLGGKCHRDFDPSEMLYETVLDLGLAAQASGSHIGSFYSNFARLSLLLSGGNNPTLEYVSFDGVWCPFILCNAGRTDVQRLCSGRVLWHIAGIELRGKGNHHGIEVHSARRTWVDTLTRAEALVTPLTKTIVHNNSRGETIRVDDLIPTADSVRVCRETLQDLALSPGNIPRIY